MQPNNTSAKFEGTEGRHAMILTWNPQKYRWNENDLDFVERTAQGTVTLVSVGDLEKSVG